LTVYSTPCKEFGWIRRKQENTIAGTPLVPLYIFLGTVITFLAAVNKKTVILLCGAGGREAT
jgi:hypothetical protein